MNRGDFVTHDRHHQRSIFRGLVIDTWRNSDDGPIHGSVIWENGMTALAIEGDRETPGRVWVTRRPARMPAAIRKALKARITADQATIEKISDRVAWAKRLLAATGDAK